MPSSLADFLVWLSQLLLLCHWIS